jgi:hypothetical protein
MWFVVRAVRMVTLGALLLAYAGSAKAQQQRFHDDRGNYTGRNEIRNGQMLQFDSRGNQLGRVERRGNNLHYFDSRGNRLGQTECGRNCQLPLNMPPMAPTPRR